MNSETDYTLCNLDSHHGYQNAYGSGADIYGFHSLNGRSSLDTGQSSCGAYYNGDSLSPQLGTPGELPLGSGGGGGGGGQQSMGYGSGAVLGGRQSGRGASIHGYSTHSIPAAHHHHHQHHHHQSHHQQQQQQQQQQQHHHHGGSNGNGGGGNGVHPFSTHDLSMTTPADCYTTAAPQHGAQHHSLATAPNFLEITTVRSGYHSSNMSGGGGVDAVKYGSGSPGPGHLMGSPVGMTNGYLPAPLPTSSPLKTEVCTNQQGIQGKPFRWMTIKRNPTKPGISWARQKEQLFTTKGNSCVLQKESAGYDKRNQLGTTKGISWVRQKESAGYDKRNQLGTTKGNSWVRQKETAAGDFGRKFKQI
ncbi:hypothetical protein Btru_045295 [Bulinus truncatus]|nr:hypothetical protein Btru_045295 [Bulinus truncatus]